MAKNTKYKKDLILCKAFTKAYTLWLNSKGYRIVKNETSREN